MRRVSVFPPSALAFQGSLAIGVRLERDSQSNLPSLNSLLTSCVCEVGEIDVGGGGALDNLKVTFHSKKQISFFLLFLEQFQRRTCNKCVRLMAWETPRMVIALPGILYLQHLKGNENYLKLEGVRQQRRQISLDVSSSHD